MTRNCIRAASSAAIAIALAIGGPIAAQNLSESYQAAQRQDPDLAAAAAERDASAENDALARSLFRPKVEVRASAGYSRITSDIDPATGLPGTIDGVSGAGAVVFEQPLVNGQASAQARQLRAGSRAGEAQYGIARDQLALRVARAYFDVLKARDAVASLQALAQLTDRELVAAKARFDSGRSNILDVRESQAKRDTVEAQLVDSNAKLEIAEARFASLTGLDPQGIKPANPDFIPYQMPRTLDEWQADAELNSPIVAAAREQLAASEADADQYRWSSQVKLTGTGGYGQSWRGGSDPTLLGTFSSPNRVGGVVVGVKLQVPIYTGGTLGAQQRQASNRATSARARLDAAIRDVRLQVHEAWLALKASSQRALALRTSQASVEKQQAAVLTGREVGVRTQSDVLAAQAQSLENRRQLNEAIYDYEYARLVLAVAAGTMVQETLSEIDRDLIVR